MTKTVPTAQEVVSHLIIIAFPLQNTLINLFSWLLVCAIERLTNTVENITTILKTIPIAGAFSHTTGGALDPKWTRLRSSASSADRENEGLRLEMHGGNNDGKKQKAIFEFLCDAPLGDTKSRDLSETLTAVGEEGHDKSGEEVADGHEGNIKLWSWEDEGDETVLRLKWITKYACEDAKDGGSGSTSGHWGFFTWFIIM